MAPGRIFWTCALLSCAVPALAQPAPDDPLVVATNFMKALEAGDTTVLRRQLTPDAIFTGGHIGLPLAGAVDALAQPGFAGCATSSIVREPGDTRADLLGDHTPASIVAGGAATVDIVLTCQGAAGAQRQSSVTLVVSKGLVAYLGLGRSVAEMKAAR